MNMRKSCDVIREIVFNTLFTQVPESKGKLSHTVIAELDVLFRFREQGCHSKAASLYLSARCVYLNCQSG